MPAAAGEQCSCENVGYFTNEKGEKKPTVLPGGPLTPLCPLIPVPVDPLSPFSPGKPTLTRKKRVKITFTNKACFWKKSPISGNEYKSKRKN